MKKTESIVARSERVLGHAIQDGSQSSSNSDDPRASASRREQVLKAQRTHRHRTQQYIRELEKEVFRLRDDLHATKQFVDRREKQIKYMSDLLKEHDICFDADFDVKTQPFQTNDDTPELRTTVCVDLTRLSKVIPQGSCENHPAEIDPVQYEEPLLMQHPVVKATGKLGTQAGLDFILKLEEPCLPHLKHMHMGYNTGTTPRAIDYNSGPGHLLTVSSRLIRQFSERNPDQNIMQLFKVDVESLLKASANLRLDNEITPVQIWAQMKETAPDITETDVQILLQEFSKYVYCNSFGAVVERLTAVSIIKHHFGVTRSGTQAGVATD